MGLFSGKSQRIAYMDAAGQLRDNQTANNNLIAQGQTSSLNALGQGYDDAARQYNGAMSLYQPYADTGQKGFNLYADATGANGQAGYDNAKSSFHASPGYQYQVDQATDQTARKMSALGALGSGNAMTAISDRAQNLANQDYGNWMSNLNQLGQYGYNATGAQAGLMQGLGNLNAQSGRDQAGVYSGYTGMGVNNNNNAAQQIANYRMGISNAGSQASANAWGVGMNLANLAASLAGSAMGMPGMGGSGGTGMGGKGGTGQFELPQAFG